MGDKSISIPNDDKQDPHFCGWKLLVETFGYFFTFWTKQLKLVRVPKVFEPTNKTKLWVPETRVIYSTMFPTTSLGNNFNWWLFSLSNGLNLK